MLKRYLNPPRRTTARSVRDEVATLCQHGQLRKLGLNRHQLRDIGLDCGADREQDQILVNPLLF